MVEEAKNSTMGAIAQNLPPAKTASKSAPAKKTSSFAKSGATKPAAGGKGKTCPTCNKGQLVEKTAKASGKKFFGCSSWPNCNYTEWPK